MSSLWFDNAREEDRPRTTQLNNHWSQTMAITEKEWSMLAEARNLDPATGKKIEPEYDAHGSPSRDSAWTDRDISELQRAIRGLRDEVAMATRWIMAGIGTMVILHFIH
jgi:hypothetical protein